MYFQVDTMKLQLWLTLYFHNVRHSVNLTFFIDCLFYFIFWKEKIKFLSVTYRYF